MTYEDFKHLAEHPQHRDVPAIFKLEVLETEELEEKKRSHYPKYKVNTYCPQAFTTTLEEAERLMHQECPVPQEDEGGRRLSAGYLLLLYLGDSAGTVALRPRMSFGKDV